MKNKVVRGLFFLFLGAFLCGQGCRSSVSDAEKTLNEAEQYYLQGTSSNHNSEYETSTYYLKQAEQVLQDMQPDRLTPAQTEERDRLLGLTWFHLGNTSESEMLYDIARDYYRQAIPLLRLTDNKVYLACAYRDIARTTALTGGERDSVLFFFQQASDFARQAQSDVLQLDIEAYRYQLCFPDSIDKRLTVCKRLAETYSAHARYSEIVEMYLARHDTDSAAYYLRRLVPADSSYTYWFEQTYTYWHSQLLYERGRRDSAYTLLLDLYDRKIDELQRDAGARTYALTLHYDVAREQQLAAEAQRERQYQRTVSIILVLLLLLLSALFAVLWYITRLRRREQAARLQSLQNKYKQQLELALERLKQKVSLTREMELQRMRGNEVEFPKWLKTYRDEQLTMNKASLDALIQSVDQSLDGAISRLRRDYPQLTESDMQFAILTIIGASDSDMGILLGVQKQTIYHRRQIVRKHINSEIEDIDQWLRNYVLSTSYQ